MTNKTKLKVATVLLAGGLAVATGVQCQNRMDSYDNQLKKEISNMTQTQLEDNIKECDIALERLQQIIDSDGTNPEERFAARGAYKSISQERELLQKRLDEIQKSKPKTINFHGAGKLR